ncbi:MAG: TonB-dependent receptor [Vicinamibacterales bacterium]|nr:TonB-dependent receptor [Vicinamibacterales bacterium]
MTMQAWWMRWVVALVMAVAVAPVAYGQDGPVRVVVVDASGAPLADAALAVERDGTTSAGAVAAADGSAVLDRGGPGRLRVSAPGFAEATVAWPPAPAQATLRVVLMPASFADTVVVTASRGTDRLPSPASTTVISAAELLTSAAGTLDDLLRATPGFSLFRRSSSRVANPTTQGVTLRGVSGSGASRTLVLADGVPLNDPFGSWVYWNRIPQAAIERVEVVRGGAGDLYGADALGGVVQVLTFTPVRPRVRATLDAGAHDTVRASVFGGVTSRGWQATVAGEMVDTAGTPTVAEADRGPVDIPADSDYRNGFVSIGRQADQWRASVRLSAFQEARGNGTPLQVNDTNWRQLSGEAGGVTGGGAWELHASAGRQSYYQTFTAVLAGRAAERLTTEQRTPSDFTQFSGQWMRDIGAHGVVVGAEARATEATVNETAYSLTGVPTASQFGGEERSQAVYGRTRIALANQWSLGLGARVDWWRSTPLNPALDEKSVTFFSPRASLVWRPGAVGLQASAYRSHRTPTLNELHRGFRVGNAVTRPNPLLEPEQLTGAEGGLLLTTSRVSARVTGFINELDGAIANITLSSTPALITRERRNSDRVRARGVELEADVRLHPTLTVNGLAVFTASHFRGSVATPAIEGNRVPQVPAYQLGAGLTWADPRLLTAALQVRVSGMQFDDDRNAFELASYTVVDLSLSREISGRLHAFMAVENLFDAEYDVGRTPLRTIGWPRTARAGVRVFLP